MRVIRTLRDGGAAADPAEASPAPEAPAPTPVERMERALLDEGTDPDAAAVAAAARDAEDLLAPAWGGSSGEIERPSGARIGADLTIVSVGEAVRSGDREVVLPLVLGDSSGQTSTLLLTLRLDALVDPSADEGPA